MGGYIFCNYIHISGPLTMVVMGLMVGNFKQDITMSGTKQEYVYKFWELVDVILNAILFIIIALVLIVINFKTPYIILRLVSIVIVLLSKIIIIYFPYLVFSKLLKLSSKEVKIITWGGLRGELSLALVLYLPNNETIIYF